MPFYFSFVSGEKKNVFLFGLGLLLVLGAGEEISWGQQILHFSTPKSIKKVNVQEEFNIHNLEVFNDQNLQMVKKTGLQRLLEINFLYRIFCFVYLVCVPLFFFHLKPRVVTTSKIQMPVVPFTIGIFFLMSWALSYGLKYYLLPPGKVREYYATSGEIFEFTTAYIYFIAALYFYKKKDNSFLGRDIKQTLLRIPLKQNLQKVHREVITY